MKAGIKTCFNDGFNNMKVNIKASIKACFKVDETRVLKLV